MLLRSLLRLHPLKGFILHPSLPSTGWILLVNNILWYLSPLGKVCSQLLYRASWKQLAHSAGTQWLLHAIRPKWHPVGRQRRDYQRVYLGVLGKIKWVRTWRLKIRTRVRVADEYLETISTPGIQGCRSRKCIG